MERKKTSLQKKNSVIRNMEIISSKAEDSKFSQKFIVSVTPNARELSKFFGCSETQAILFSIIFSLNFKWSTVSISEIASFLECNAITIMSHFEDLEELIRLKLIRKSHSNSSRKCGRGFKGLNTFEMFVNSEVMKSILEEKKFTSCLAETPDMYDLLMAIHFFLEEREDGVMTYDEMSLEICSLLQNCDAMPFIQSLNELELGNEEKFILLDLCYEYSQDEETVELPSLLKKIFPDMTTQIRIRKSLVRGDNDLLMKDIVTLEESWILSDRTLKLTEKAIDLLFFEDKTLFLKRKKSSRQKLILYDEIVPKTLYFNDQEKKGLNFLKQVLVPDKFKSLKERMNANGFSQGFCALFYGPPGTGKTESVYQLARETGRDIIMVVTSETKSKWFGESEKRIKLVFDEYRKIVDQRETAPILLFNEADGIFSSRKDVESSEVAQTENAIQNIILQEMEDLNGILIATTNLTHNLDKAFERRFLYKIKFEKPNAEFRFRIWKEKLGNMPEKALRRLSEKFNFSGGQIDNIARKTLSHKILYGKTDINTIESFCTEELIGKDERVRIGYKISLLTD